jgi:hypothetical protein
VGWFDWN